MCNSKVRLIAGPIFALLVGVGCSAHDKKVDDKTTIVMPKDPKAVVISYDPGAGGRVRKGEPPYLKILADGHVTVTNLHDGVKRESKLTPNQLDDLLHFIIVTNDFFNLSETKIKAGITETTDAPPVVASGTAGNVTITVDADRKKHEISFRNANSYLQAYPKAVQLAQFVAVEKRLIDVAAIKLNAIYIVLLVLAYGMCFFLCVFRRKSLKPEDSESPWRLPFASFVFFSFVASVLIAGISYYAEDGSFSVLMYFIVWTWSIAISYLLWVGRHIMLTKVLGGSVVLGTAFMFTIGGSGNALRAVDTFVMEMVSDKSGGAGEPEKAPKKSKIEEHIPTVDASHRIGVSDLLRAAYVFINSYTVVSFLTGLWLAKLHAQLKADPKYAPTFQSDALEQVFDFISIAVSGWVVLLISGGNVVSASIVAAIGGLAVSVAFQDLLKNFVAGLLLLWDRTIKKGDVISLDGKNCGVVEALTMRYMVIIDKNDISTLVPHSLVLNSKIENWSRDIGHVGLNLEIGVAYKESIKDVQQIMKNVCFHVPRVLKKPAPAPVIIRCGDSAIEFQLRFKIKDPENGIRNVMSEVYLYLLSEFKKKGIVIPFPQMEVMLKENTDEKSKPLTMIPFMAAQQVHSTKAQAVS